MLRLSMSMWIEVSATSLLNLKPVMTKYLGAGSYIAANRHRIAA